MKTKISIFIAAIALLFGVTTTLAQGTQAYFKKDGVTVFQSAISDIDSIVFYNPAVSEENMLDEPMSDELLQFFESCPVSQYTDINDFDLSDIGLRSAEVQSPLIPLFREMGIEAVFLTDRSNFKEPAGDDPEKQPEQNGLAYTYGRKDYKKRMVGMDKYKYDEEKKTWITIYKNDCPEELYGLDCSGFIYYIFQAAKIDIPLGQAIDQINKLKSQTEIKNNPYYNGKIEVKEIPVNAKFNSSSLRSGDIIYKQLSSGAIEHIGIILKEKTKGTVVIFHSIGSYNVSCETNKDTLHGPIQSALENDRIEDYFGKLPTSTGQPHILRFIDMEEYPPTVTIKEATNITSTAANLSGSLTITGNTRIDSSGFCWDTIPYPTIEKSYKNLIVTEVDGQMASNITNLKQNKKYFARAYGKIIFPNDSSKVYYSDEITFNTDKDKQDNLCAINGNWSGSQIGSITTSVTGIPSQTTSINEAFGFVVENCNIQAGSFQESGVSMSFSGSMTGNNVTIYLTINTDGSDFSQNWTYTGQLNADNNKISGTWTLSASYGGMDVSLTQSGSGTWEVSK